VTPVARLPRLASSFRARFLLVVLLAAVVPLALIGVWLTRSVVRAGQELLRSELDKSLARIAAPVATRWSYRMGELGLLAHNEVAARAIALNAAAALIPADSAYLAQLFSSVAQAIPAFEYRDAGGRVRWSSPAAAVDTLDTRSQPVVPPSPGPTMTVRLPVAVAPGGPSRGELIAQVSLAAVIPIDTALRLPNGARLQLVQRATRQALLPAFVPDSLLGRNRFTANGTDWLAVHRSFADPELDLTLAAPLGAYVEPFERAARAGVLTLAVVSLLALLFSTFLTTRLTSSLEQLAVAADAVSDGDLEHRIGGSGSDEVGRVAAAFNSMMENLRRTLGELSERQALAAVGEYAASLAHEVRNGLTSIRVDLQRAEEKTGEDAPGRSLIARALENVKRLDGTVSASLRAARGGRAPRRRVDLRPVLRSAGQSADGAFAERGGILTPMAPDFAAAWVLGDVMALEQLFLNLLLNSAQALGRGGQAAIVVDLDGSDVRVVVSDTGAGISPEDLAHALDPFFSTKPDGTGLGLSIARQIAAAHGGSLRIESVRGAGTRVEVRLPLAAAPPGAARSTPASTGY
jgi:two-component system sensor histidine kinase AtoS